MVGFGGGVYGLMLCCWCDGVVLLLDVLDVVSCWGCL